LLAFVAAEGREFDGFLAHAERVEKLDLQLDFARKIWWNGREAVLVANGPGPKLAGRAAKIAKEQGDLEGLVSTGFCGGLDPALQPCDIFVATEILGDPAGKERFPATPAHAPAANTGKLLSINRVATTIAEKSDLRATGAAAIEMEAAGVEAKASEWSMPFYCIRVVTDTANESFPLDFNRLRDADGRFSRSKIIGAALRRPSVFPQLIKLNSRCKLASEALGDFIASCRF
jgi:adenosylhomocysteine nucleosidase